MKKYLKILLSLLIVALALYFTFRNAPFGEIGKALGSVRYIPIAVGVIIILVAMFFRTYRMKLLLKSMVDVPTRALYGPTYIGFMSVLIVSRAAELIRAHLIGKKAKIPFSSALAAIFVERIFDTTAILLVFGGILLFSDAYSGLGTITIRGEERSLEALLHHFGLVSIVVALGIIAFSMVLLHWPERVKRAMGFLMRPLPAAWRGKVLHMVDSFSRGLHILKSVGSVLSIAVTTALVWIFLLGAYYPVLVSFGIGYPVTPPAAALLIGVMVCIFITVAPTPGFLGVFQAACVITLVEVLKPPVEDPSAVAAAYGIVAWFVHLIPVLVVGLIYLLLEHVSLFEIEREGLAEVDAEEPPGEEKKKDQPGGE